MAEKRDSYFPRVGDYSGSCSVCGQETSFAVRKANQHLRETFVCRYCGSMARHRHLALVLKEIFGNNMAQELKIYNAESSGPIHNLLRKHPGYTYSEFSQLNRSDRYQDLQQLTFADDVFDLVITQDVFEHIRKPIKAWLEVGRVLKPHGYHIFTVPCSKRCPTIPRVEVSGDEDVYLLPKVYHGDPLPDRLLYNNFGNDLPATLEKLGFETKVFWHDDLDREKFRIYAGAVFVTKRP